MGLKCSIAASLRLDKANLRTAPGHDESYIACITLDTNTNRLFRRGNAEVCECIDVAQHQMNEIPELCLNDENVFVICTNKSELFLDGAPDDDYAKTKGHAAWYRERFQ